jgi:hypothetical protein
MNEQEKIRYGCAWFISVACVFFMIGLFVGMWIGA